MRMLTLMNDTGLGVCILIRVKDHEMHKKLPMKCNTAWR